MDNQVSRRGFVGPFTASGMGTSVPNIVRIAPNAAAMTSFSGLVSNRFAMLPA